jgi:hypothetical protein
VEDYRRQVCRKASRNPSCDGGLLVLAQGDR